MNLHIRDRFRIEKIFASFSFCLDDLDDPGGPAGPGDLDDLGNLGNLGAPGVPEGLESKLYKPSFLLL